MNNLGSLRARNTFWRVLKVVTFALGMPLLIYLLKFSVDGIKYADAETLSFIDGASVIFKYVALGAVALAVVMIIVGLLFKRNRYLVRALICAIVGFAVVAAPLAYFQFIVIGDYETMREDFIADYDYDIGNIGDHANKYQEKFDNHYKDLNKFLEKYNIEYNQKLYSGDKNTDLTPTINMADEQPNTDIFLEGFGGLEHYAFGLEAGDVTYSINGMYADGYVFSFAQAEYIFKTYYGARNEYKEMEKDIDEALEKALEDLEKNSNSLWNKYKLTTNYKIAYGDMPSEGEMLIGDETYDMAKMYAAKYYVDSERLEELLNAAVEYLQDDLSDSAKETVGVIVGLLNAINVIDFTIDIDKLTYESLVELLEGFGLDIMSLIENYSFYYSPIAYPIFYFIENETLRDYAYAKYYATKHGAKVGSVLISDGNIGEVTFDSSGEPAMSEGELLSLFKRIRIEEEYMEEFYPWFAVREQLLLFAGIVPLTIFFAYMFADFEKKNLNKMIKGGAK